MDKRFLTRGKRNDGLSGEWVTGYYVDVKSPMIYTGERLLDGKFDWYDVDPATVGRCTGLVAAKSYRGDSEDDRLVFEGDIVKHETGRHAEVVWHEHLGMWDLIALNSVGFVDNRICWDKWKIIGNIHDNP